MSNFKAVFCVRLVCNIWFKTKHRRTDDIGFHMITSEATCMPVRERVEYSRTPRGQTPNPNKSSTVAIPEMKVISCITIFIYLYIRTYIRC